MNWTQIAEYVDGKCPACACRDWEIRPDEDIVYCRVCHTSYDTPKSEMKELPPVPFSSYSKQPNVRVLRDEINELKAKVAELQAIQNGEGQRFEERYRNFCEPYNKDAPIVANATAPSYVKFLERGFRNWIEFEKKGQG